MAKSIIDELVVVLGLDATQFNEEQKKAAQSLIDTRSTLEDSVSSMGSTLMGFAGKLTAFFLGFEGLKGVIDLVKNTAAEFKNLGITAELLGTSVKNARIAQEFSQLAGAGPNALSDWVMQGRMGLSNLILGQFPSITLPGLIGFDWRTAWQGKTPTDVYNKWVTAAKAHVGTLMALEPGASSPEMAVQQFLMHAGVPAPLAAEATNKKHLADDENRAMRDNIGVTKRSAEAGRSAINALISLRYQVENLATKGFGPLTTATGLLEKAFEDLMGIINNAISGPIGQLLTGKIGPLKALEKESAAEWKWLGGGIGNLLDIGSTSKIEHPIADFFSQFMGGGEDWRLTGTHGFQSLDQSAPILRLAPISMPSLSGISLPALQFQSAGAMPVPPSASLLGPGGQSNSYAIGSISVNTKATDAAGIAADMNRAIQRKFDVTQADSGMLS